MWGSGRHKLSGTNKNKMVLQKKDNLRECKIFEIFAMSDRPKFVGKKHRC